MWMKLFLMSLVAVMAHSLSLRDEDTQIYNPNDRNNGTFNIIASLFFKKTNTRFCSAFFVSNQHVVTTYSCIHKKHAKDIRVSIFYEDEIVKSFNSQFIYEHPNSNFEEYNFAVIKLKSIMYYEATVFSRNQHPAYSTIGHYGHYFKFTNEGQFHYRNIIVPISQCISKHKKNKFCVITDVMLEESDIGGPLGVFYDPLKLENHIAIYTGFANDGNRNFLLFQSAYPVYDWIEHIINGTREDEIQADADN